MMLWVRVRMWMLLGLNRLIDTSGVKLWLWMGLRLRLRGLRLMILMTSWTWSNGLSFRRPGSM